MFFGFLSNFSRPNIWLKKPSGWRTKEEGRNRHGNRNGSQAVPDGVVATLKVSKGAFEALNKGSGALGKVK